MKSRILDFLRRTNNYLSGEDLSRTLRISRAGIWKHIQELRKDGYDIVAVPHLGYKLISCPDKLLPEEISSSLNTKIIGRKIYYFNMVSSTMDIAFNLGVKDTPEGTVVCAEGQTKGRGRLARHWISPKEKGIYISIILRPRLLPNETSKLTLLAAVSVCEAIRSVTHLECQIKWPNDILINEKKVGGILTELNAEMDMVKFLIIGIGINVNSTKSILLAKSTSLKEELSQEVSRVELVKQILRKLETNYLLFQKEGFSPIAEEWRHLSATLNKRVKVSCQKEHIEGEAIDIDMDGGLLIRNDSGFIEKVLAGDVVYCR